MLIAGASGRGKSDLALRLIDRGARLVSDDYTVLRADGGRLVASAPTAIAGRLEIRGVGIIDIDPVREAPVCLIIDLDQAPERLPEPSLESFLGLDVPLMAVAALEASAPIKVEFALDRYGLPAA